MDVPDDMIGCVSLVEPNSLLIGEEVGSLVVALFVELLFEPDDTGEAVGALDVDTIGEEKLLKEGDMDVAVSVTFDTVGDNVGESS